MELGKKYWAIAEGYIPIESHGKFPEMESHETVCILNANEKAAHIEITIYFNDRDPIGPFKEKIAPKRTRHIRFNNLQTPEKIPKGTDFASTIISDVPIVVQHTRLDSRQAENALMTTIAYSQ
ncbi:MAG: sensory rhodopsin transducer [Bacteriovoracaceae bacterium]|nr:sensory rhodopsin transducer [Bacteriovoracaceae bacterium]